MSCAGSLSTDGRQHAETVELETLRAACRFLDQQPKFLPFLGHDEADEGIGDLAVRRAFRDPDAIRE